MSLIEFLDLPTHVCDYILDISGKQADIDDKQHAKVINELNKESHAFNQL